MSVFLTGFCYFSYQVATQLSSRGWVNPVPDPILPDEFLGYSLESNPGSLGWQSDMLTSIPNRRSGEWNGALLSSVMIVGSVCMQVMGRTYVRHRPGESHLLECICPRNTGPTSGFKVWRPSVIICGHIWCFCRVK